MLATPVRENGSQPMVGNYENEVHYTREEFMDELAKQDALHHSIQIKSFL